MPAVVSETRALSLGIGTWRWQEDSHHLAEPLATRFVAGEPHSLTRTQYAVDSQTLGRPLCPHLSLGQTGCTCCRSKVSLNQARESSDEALTCDAATKLICYLDNAPSSF